MNWTEILSMIGTIVLMIAVFVGAYYVSKFVGKRYQTRYDFSKNISILESRNIGKDKALLIVKAGDKAFLVGSSPHQLTLIGELNPDGLVEVTNEMPEKRDFSSVLRTALKGKDKKHGGGENE